jgi:hypothetical protein
VTDQHVRLLSPEPFGWLPPPKPTRAWEPTLLWNHFISNADNSRIMGIRMREFACQNPDGARQCNALILRRALDAHPGVPK